MLKLDAQTQGILISYALGDVLAEDLLEFDPLSVQYDKLYTKV